MHQKIKKTILDGKMFCKVEHVARSGMSRRISFFMQDKDDIINVSKYIADRLERPHRNQSVVVSGCGMDMIFHTLYTYL